MKQKTIEELIKAMNPRELAIGLVRAESDGAGENLYLYRKGAKSMLQNFVNDAEFVTKVMEEFDRLYAGEEE